MSRWYRLTSGNAMREFWATVSKGNGSNYESYGRYVGGTGYRGRRVRDSPHPRTQHVLPGVALDHPGSRRGTDLVGGRRGGLRGVPAGGRGRTRGGLRGGPGGVHDVESGR